LLGQLARPGRDVIADFEAGLGTVLRLDGHPVDVVLIVVEPTVKSLEVGRRAAESVTACGLGRVVVTANRVRSIEDEVRVRKTFPGLDPVLVPDDPAIVDAERHGLAPLDAAPDSPGVRALVDLAQSILSVG
jgi:CO dehydrogenase maturation factor